MGENEFCTVCQGAPQLDTVDVRLFYESLSTLMEVSKKVSENVNNRGQSSRKLRDLVGDMADQWGVRMETKLEPKIELATPMAREGGEMPCHSAFAHCSSLACSSLSSSSASAPTARTFPS